MSKTSTNQDIIKDIYRELVKNKPAQFKINIFSDLEINFELEGVLSEINKIELSPSKSVLDKVLDYSRSKKVVD